jgi:2-phospho-L-lactate guanylyltransferase
VTSGAWAVVVGRHGPAAKSRLAGALSAERRSALAMAMLTDVIDAAANAGFGGVAAVLTPTTRIRGDVLLVRDPGEGLARAIDAGLRAVTEAGADAVLILPGDVPLVTADELRRVIDAAREAPRSVVVVADRHGTGTNALALHPPAVIAPAFGPGSADRHLSAAAAAGARGLRLEITALSLDVDTPDDLAELARRSPRGATKAALARLADGSQG